MDDAVQSRWHGWRSCSRTASGGTADGDRKLTEMAKVNRAAARKKQRRRCCG
ncbi:MAG: hypothetical protein U0736_19125 [Gemmataceae bacterium]